MQDEYERAIGAAERIIRAGARFDQVVECLEGLEPGDKEKTVAWLMAGESARPYRTPRELDRDHTRA